MVQGTAGARYPFTGPSYGERNSGRNSGYAGYAGSAAAAAAVTLISTVAMNAIRKGGIYR